MCGIAGEIRSTSKPSPANWDAISQLMARRGPDAKGEFEDKRATLVFRRLSVLDPSAASHQPMLDATGRYVLAFNGEIYNFPELKAQLTGAGHVFRSEGDTEVLLQALIAWGIEALGRLNGMFALALFDRLDRSLVLARDHAGIKPLYVLHHDEGVAFASQYDQIMAHPWSADLSWSKAAVGQYLRIGYLPAPAAMLESTEMLPAGTWLRVTSDGATVRGSHFRFPRQPERREGRPPSDDELDDALTRAVQRQMVSDVPLGSFLSGGVDSPLVTALAAQCAPRPIAGFTIADASAEQDESLQAARYATELGIDHHRRSITSADALELMNDVVDAYTEPNSDFSIFPTMLVSRLARESMTVMLSGDGGDELFWGYPGRFGSILELAEDFRQPRWWRNARRAATRYLGIGSAAPNLRMSSIGAWYHAKHCHLNEDDLQMVLPDAPRYPHPHPLSTFNGGSQDETADWMRWSEFSGHLSRVLMKVDRASMHCSLEVRVPLLDLEVLKLALRYNWRACLDLERRVGKLPLRAVLSRRVSQQSTEKMGFSVPMGAWLRGPLRELLEERLVRRDSLVGIPVHRRGAEDMVRAHISGTRERGWGLWQLLSLALWEDRHARSLGHART